MPPEQTQKEAGIRGSDTRGCTSKMHRERRQHLSCDGDDRAERVAPHKLGTSQTAVWHSRWEPAASFEAQLVEHRVYRVRFARLRLRNDARAENALFGTIKTWLVGILQHQVIEMLRSHTRELSAPYDAANGGGDKLGRLAFKADGYFMEQPNDWGDPHQTRQQRQFFQVPDTCMERLPRPMGQLFVMRAAVGGSAVTSAKLTQSDNTNLLATTRCKP